MEGVWLIVFLIHGGLAMSMMKGPPRAERGGDVIRVVGRAGEEVKLRCPVVGHPAPLVTWSRGGQGEVDYTYPRFRANKKTLKIKAVEKDDTGVYICKAINGFGKVEIEVELMVIHPEELGGLDEEDIAMLAAPKMSWGQDGRMTESIVEGHDIKLRCMVDGGYPTPSLIWYKDSMLYQQGGAELTVRGASIRDSGLYTCRASNLVGNAVMEWEVRVDRLSSHSSPISNQANITVMSGESATLDCRVSAEYRPNIKWLKKLSKKFVSSSALSSEVINVGNDFYRMLENEREVVGVRGKGGQSEYLSQLVFSSAVSSDAGMYICFVTSHKGGFNFKPSFLEVLPEGQNTIVSNQDGDLPLLLLVVGVSLAATILIILTIACLVQRRGKMTSPPASPVTRTVTLAPISAAEKPIYRRNEEKLNFQLNSSRLEDLLNQTTPLNNSPEISEQQQFFNSSLPEHQFFNTNSHESQPQYFTNNSQPEQQQFFAPNPNQSEHYNVYEVPSMTRSQHHYTNYYGEDIGLNTSSGSRQHNTSYYDRR